jgi:hypothetical protein
VLLAPLNATGRSPSFSSVTYAPAGNVPGSTRIHA